MASGFLECFECLERQPNMVNKSQGGPCWSVTVGTPRSPPPDVHQHQTLPRTVEAARPPQLDDITFTIYHTPKSAGFPRLL